MHNSEGIYSIWVASFLGMFMVITLLFLYAQILYLVETAIKTCMLLDNIARHILRQSHFRAENA